MNKVFLVLLALCVLTLSSPINSSAGTDQKPTAPSRYVEEVRPFNQWDPIPEKIITFRIVNNSVFQGQISKVSQTYHPRLYVYTVTYAGYIPFSHLHQPESFVEFQ